MMFKASIKLRRFFGLPTVDGHFLASLEAITWFTRCGQPGTFDVPFPAQQVHSWDEAIAACDSRESNEAFHEADNALSSYLHANYHSRYQCWNDVVEEAKLRCIEPLTQVIWQPFAQAKSLDNVFISSVCWNVLGAVIEHEYRDCRGIPVFSTHLLDVFRHGHFPCGWAGSWPGGKLLYL